MRENWCNYTTRYVKLDKADFAKKLNKATVFFLPPSSKLISSRALSTIEDIEKFLGECL
jgi:hypothetical protein